MDFYALGSAQSIKIVEILIEMGAQREVFDLQNRSPLELAILFQNKNLSRILFLPTMIFDTQALERRDHIVCACCSIVSHRT